MFRVAAGSGLRTYYYHIFICDCEWKARAGNRFSKVEGVIMSLLNS